MSEVTNQPKAKMDVIGGLKKFIRETRIELKKVAWPSWKQLSNNTIVVITMVIIVSILIFALDKLFSTGQMSIIEAFKK